MIFLILAGKSGSLKKICNGLDNCCSEGTKCGEMEGDCNADEDCREGLKCGENNCNANAGTWKPTDGSSNHQLSPNLPQPNILEA